MVAALRAHSLNSRSPADRVGRFLRLLDAALQQEILTLNAELARESIDAFFSIDSYLPERLIVRLYIAGEPFEAFLELSGDGRHFSCKGVLDGEFECNALNGMQASLRGGTNFTPSALSQKILSALASAEKR
jgi:hypothetical protein